MRVWKTKYGPVEYRATVGGKKVAYTTLRSSYMHEADSIIGFQMLNDPDYVKSPATFQSAAQHINYTFNWFYAGSSHTAYYNSGNNPVRASGVDAEFPVWISTLKTAAGASASTVYPGDSLCSAGDQWCADSIACRSRKPIRPAPLSGASLAPFL